MYSHNASQTTNNNSLASPNTNSSSLATNYQHHQNQHDPSPMCTALDTLCSECGKHHSFSSQPGILPNTVHTNRHFISNQTNLNSLLMSQPSHQPVVERILNTQLSVVPNKDFAAEVRAIADIRKFVSDAFISIDIRRSRVFEIVDEILERLAKFHQLGADVISEAKNSLFVDSQRPILAQTMQGMYTTRTDGRLAYDNSWLVAMCNLTSISKRHVAITKLAQPTNFGRQSQEVRLLVLILAPNKEKATKCARETGRTFATILADLNFRHRLYRAKNEYELRIELLTFAEMLAAPLESFKKMCKRQANYYNFRNTIYDTFDPMKSSELPVAAICATTNTPLSLGGSPSFEQQQEDTPKKCVSRRYKHQYSEEDDYDDEDEDKSGKSNECGRCEKHNLTSGAFVVTSNGVVITQQPAALNANELCTSNDLSANYYDSSAGDMFIFAKLKPQLAELANGIVEVANNNNETKEFNDICSRQKCLSNFKSLGAGLFDDYKRRSKFYFSDFKDGICGYRSFYKTTSTTIFLYFSVLLPTIAFGVLDTNNTQGEINLKKTLAGQAVGGVFYALFSGQPLIVLMTTAPLCIYVKVIYQISKDFEVEFLPFYACVTLWMGLFLTIMSLTNVSNLIKYCTRSTEDIFAIFTAFAFGSDGVKEAVYAFRRYYYDQNCYKQPAHKLTPSHLSRLHVLSSSSANKTIDNNSTNDILHYLHTHNVQRHVLSAPGDHVATEHSGANSPLQHLRLAAAQNSSSLLGSTLSPLISSSHQANHTVFEHFALHHNSAANSSAANFSHALLGAVRDSTSHVAARIAFASTNAPLSLSATTQTAYNNQHSSAPSLDDIDNGNGGGVCRREICILFLFLMCGTLWLANSFSSFNQTPYLSARKREMIKDYALAISVLIFSFIGSYLFADIQLGAFEFGQFTSLEVARLDVLTPQSVLIAVPLGFMLSVLFYIDQNICGEMVNNAPYRLKKGNYFHLDLLVVAVLNVTLGLFGFPLMHGKLPHSHLHAKALADYEERVDEGFVHQTIVNIRETRLTGLFCSLLIGLSFLSVPYPLSYIPLPVLSGVFLYTALAEFKSNSMVERVCLFFTEQAAYPPNHYIRRCPQRKIHLFTVCQLFQLALVSFVGFYPNPYVQMAYPLIVATFVPFRQKLLPALIDEKYLNSLDRHAHDPEFDEH